MKKKEIKWLINKPRGLFLTRRSGTLRRAVGEQSFTKTGINIGVGVLCLVLAPEVGLIIGISYFVLDQCGLIDPIADFVEDIFTLHRPVQRYIPNPNIIVPDKTKVMIERKSLPIILKKD